MKKINLLKSIKKIKRQIKKRKINKNNNIIKTARKFDREYFDGPRKYGYGGYHYDGRWKKVAKDFIKYYKLKPGDKVLDIGCAKEYLIKEFLDKKIDAYGLDISRYALKNCHPDVKSKLTYGNAKKLPFKNNSFKLVISINTLHNLIKKDCKIAIKEIMRISKKHKYIQVDAYRNKDEKKIFEDWVLTAKFHTYCDKWEKFFKEIRYNGEYYWTFV